MIKGRGVMHLDGDFKRDYPEHEVFSLRVGKDWTIVKRGPSYVNRYDVSEFDEAGERWLIEHNRSEGATKVQSEENQKGPADSRDPLNPLD